MKINDVIIKEMGSRGHTAATKPAAAPAKSPTTADDMPAVDPMGNPIGMTQGTVKQTTPQPAPSGAAGQTKWPTTDAEIKAFQTANKLKADGLIGAKTMAALQKSGATPPPGFKPVGPKAAKQPAKQPATTAPAADPSIDPYDPNKDTNVKMTPQSEIQAAQSDADKKAAISANLPPVAAPAQQGAPNDDIQRLAQLAGSMRQQTTPDSMPTTSAVTPQSIGATNLQGEDPLKTAAPNSGSSYTGNIGTATNDPPAGQAAQPAATTNPDTGLDATPKPVTTGTGGKTNMVTGSDDEMAWRAKNPNWNMTGKQYPGAGNWDPNTGRDKKLQAQADANAAAVKGFFNKINPFASKPQDAGPAGNVNNQSSGYTQPQQESAELAILRKLSGLK